jgi:hypothetical protein
MAEIEELVLQVPLDDRGAAEQLKKISEAAAAIGAGEVVERDADAPPWTVLGVRLVGPKENKRAA